MDEQPIKSAGDGLSAALDSIFSDPATRERFETMVKTLRENMDRTPPVGQDPPPEPKEEKTPPSEWNGAETDGLASILSNPTLMANLPSLLAGMRTPPPTSESSRGKSPEDLRRDLLLALKPFLSKDRSNAVEMILQISRLGAVLRMMH